MILLLTLPTAAALRNYETLSLNSLPVIPAGSRLLGSLDIKQGWPEPTGAIAPWLWHYGKPFFEQYPGLLKSIAAFAELIDSVAPLPGRDCSIFGMVWTIIKQALNIEYIQRLEPLQSKLSKMGFRELDRKGREDRTKKQAFNERLLMACFGGIALIGPMLIMVLLPGKKVTLITTSVATFLFALVLAILANDSAGKDVLGATAAYAAVLVVFVGTSAG
jgi:hypothetical protein